MSEADEKKPAGHVPLWVIANMGCRTTREWKAKKRGELEATIAAMDAFRMGCAYVPGYSAKLVQQIDDALGELRERLCEEWGGGSNPVR